MGYFIAVILLIIFESYLTRKLISKSMKRNFNAIHAVNNNKYETKVTEIL